jgi:hypothetical protein
MRSTPNVIEIWKSLHGRAEAMTRPRRSRESVTHISGAILEPSVNNQDDTVKNRNPPHSPPPPLERKVLETPTYASLLNRKLLVPSARQPMYIAVDRHFMMNLMMPMLERVPVDEAWYTTTYPDVGTAIKGSVVANATDHYRRFGYYEHRMPYAITVDEAWYLKEYPDIREAVTAKTFTSGQAHFNLVGFGEGRFPFAGFRLDERR